MKKVCVYTGSRANYSSSKSIMRAIQKNNDLELQVVLGGAGVLDRFGNIEKLIEEDGFEINFKYYNIVEGENPITMAKSTGLSTIELSLILNNLKPDLMLVVGDRFDVMAPTIAASYMNIPIAHTMGGEISGTIDASIRHAITKMAHLHFPANEDAKERIIKMGELPENVFNFGCPRIDLVKEIIDNHNNGERIDQDDFFTRYKGVGGRFDLEKEKFLLVSQHPVTTEYGKNREYIEQTLLALNELKMPTIMIWPNVDAGSDEVSKGIRTFREKYRPDWLHLFINLPIDIYTKLINICACMIGNSSSAIREGAFIGVPALNIGTRQHGRMKGSNLMDINPDKVEILDALTKQLKHGKYRSEFIYGDGNASTRITDTIAKADVKIQKSFAY